MKTEATVCTKMSRLARNLGIEHWGAIGIMESLWKLAAREATAGDIGKLSNEDIAQGVWWRGNPDDLVNALVKSKWLDESEEHRLVVHDWYDHAEDGVHLKLAKSLRLFACGQVPKLTKLLKTEREKIEEEFERIKALKSAYHTLPSHTLPSQATPYPKAPPAAQEDAERDQAPAEAKTSAVPNGPLANDKPRTQVSELGIENWSLFCEAAIAASMSFDSDPAGDTCQKLWARLTVADKIASVQGIHDRIKCGQYADIQFVPTGHNYLWKKAWREKLRPRTVSGKNAVMQFLAGSQEVA